MEWSAGGRRLFEISQSLPATLKTTLMDCGAQDDLYNPTAMVLLKCKLDGGGEHG